MKTVSLKELGGRESRKGVGVAVGSYSHWSTVS